MTTGVLILTAYDDDPYIQAVFDHLANIFNKLQAKNRTEAVMRAVSFGLIHSDLSGTS